MVFLNLYCPIERKLTDVSKFLHIILSGFFDKQEAGQFKNAEILEFSAMLSFKLIHGYALESNEKE